MALQLTCRDCNKTDRYHEMLNTGTLWHPMFTVNCSGCGAQNIIDDGLHKWLIDHMLNTEYIPPDMFHEKWVQRYFKDHYERYGFSNIKGPFSNGPDFKGFYNGRETGIEVEWSWKNYLLHKHHLNPAFDNTDVLVSFYPIMNNEVVSDLIPLNMVFIDLDHFYSWYEPKAKEYKMSEGKKDITSRFFNLISGEISKRFMQACTDQDRESAMCPDCNVCPYVQDEIDFFNWTVIFTQSHLASLDPDQSLTLSDFICSIEPAEFDSFMELIL